MFLNHINKKKGDVVTFKYPPRCTAPLGLSVVVVVFV